MHARARRPARAGLMAAVAVALLGLVPGNASGQPDTRGDGGPAGHHDHAQGTQGSHGITDGPEDDVRLDHPLPVGHGARAAQDQLSETLTGSDGYELGRLDDLSGSRGRRGEDLQFRGRGDRFLDQGTTDVWAHRGFGYIGTFNVPCGTGESFVEGGPVELVRDVDEPGIAIFDVRNDRRPRYVGNLPSVEGSRINDIKVDRFGRRDILVHSNEVCAGGPGGFEIYDVTNVRQPVHLSSVRIDEPNEVLQTEFDGVDRGVHNLFLFEQGRRDFVALATHLNAWFGSVQIFEVTDPRNPELVSVWGPELLCEEDFCSDDPYNETDPDVLVDMINFWIFGQADGPTPGFGNGSLARSVHDITVTEDGNLMYAPAWDSGLVLLDISDPANPEVVSQALDPENGSLDGEVNSHSSWPSEDGTIVVEGEEDFSAWEPTRPPDSLSFGDGDPTAPLPGTAIATLAGDDFEEHQTGNVGTVVGSEVTVTDGPLAGSTYPAFELIGDQPAFPEGGQTGELVYVGRLCDIDEPLNPDAVDEGDIAVVRRGECSFREKNFNAADLGAAAIVIANNLRESTPWSGIRIWDYSDPENPVLASTYDTECSAAATPIEGCELAGTYSVHNMVVETQGNRVLAYISWYWDGMVVLDVTDPYNPVEVDRFFDSSPEFIEGNGGRHHDFWGVWKIPNRPTIYGADRNGGLYTFRLTRGR